jgi:CRP-like cAMP-binding protein
VEIPAQIEIAILYSPGQRVFAEGERGDALFVIVRGTIEIRRGGHTVSTLGAGEAFGEMVVLDEVPRSADAVAGEETDLLRIGSEEFYELLHEQVEIAEGVIRMLTNRGGFRRPAGTGVPISSIAASCHEDPRLTARRLE